MTDRDSVHPVQARLAEILGQVRAALRAGDYAALDRLAAEQGSLIDALIGAPARHLRLPAPEIQRLLASAERTRRMLAASISGLKSAAQRQRERAEGRATSRIYTEGGHRARLETPAATLEKRS